MSIKKFFGDIFFGDKAQYQPTPMKFLGGMPNGVYDCVILLHKISDLGIYNYVNGILYGINSQSNEATALQAKICIEKANNSASTAGILNYIATQGVYASLITCTYNGENYVALRLNCPNYKYYRLGLWFSGVWYSSAKESLQMIPTTSVSNISDFNSSENTWDYSSARYSNIEGVLSSGISYLGAGASQIGSVSSYVTLTSGQTMTVNPGGNAKLFSIRMSSGTSSGYAALFFAEQRTATIIKIADPSNKFGVGDTGTLIRVYKSANDHSITIKQSISASENIAVCFHGGY